MDLKNFYLENVKESDYHYRFKKNIEDINNTYCSWAEDTIETEIYKFDVDDAEDAINKFKELCQPGVEFSDEKKCWFYLITFYLNSLGYVIKEFPKVLARPPYDPLDFAYKDIVNKLVSQGKACNGVVRWATRRSFVSQFTFDFKSSNIILNDDINEKFMEISTRQANFNSMSKDEKIAEIVNIIENILKKNGKYLELDYSKICCDFITDNQIKKYKQMMQCFRHCSDESISERKSYTEKQKDFLIDYGLTIVKVIYNSQK